VGGSAQIKAMKQVAGRLRLDLAQYREMEAFAKFGSDLDEATQQQLRRGVRLVEILKQGQYVPMPFEKQILIIYAGTNGFLDQLPVGVLGKFEKEFIEHVEMKHAEILTEIADKKVFSDELKEKLNKALESFLAGFKVEG
jgi:F-type H+-transporting ATPase subunit alpha